MSLIEEQEERITTTHGTMTRAQLASLNESLKQKKNEPLREEPAKTKCPIIRRNCGNFCALYDNGSCAILTGAGCIADKLCPFWGGSYTKNCSKDCMMYTEGSCALTGKRGAENVKV